MRRFRFIINLGLLLLPLGFLSTGAVLFVRQIWRYLNSDARLAGVLSAEATRALGREVRIGDVKITGNLWGLSAINRVELRDVFVAEGQTPSRYPFVRAEKVVLWYNLRQILLTKDLRVPLVNEIELIRPQASLIRDAQGRWNFDALLKPQAQAGRPSFDKLSFTDGALYYSDQAVPHPVGVSTQPLITQLLHVSGVALTRPDKSVAFDVSAQPQPEIARDFHATGVANLAPVRIAAHVTAHRLALPFLAVRLIPLAKARINRGLADIDAGVVYAPLVNPINPARSAANSNVRSAFDPNAVDAQGSLVLSGLYAESPALGAPLENVNGAVTFTTDALLANLTGGYRGARFAVQGGVLGVWGTSASGGRQLAAAPTLNLQGQVAQADFARLLQIPQARTRVAQLPTAARGLLQNLRGDAATVAFRVAGALNHPDVLATTIWNGIRTGGLRADGLNVRARLADRALDVDLRGRYAQGEAAVRAQIVFDATGAFEAEAHGKGLQIGALGLPQTARLSLAGRGDLDAAIRGRKGRTPNITAQVQVYDAKLNGQSVNSIFARAETVGRSLVLRTLRAEDAKGFALASGTLDLSTNALDLNVGADEIDLHAIASALTPVLNPAKQSRQPKQAGASKMARLPGTPSGTPNQTRPSSASKSARSARTLAAGAPGGDLLATARGIGYFRGRVTRSLQSPLLSGRLSAFAVQAGKAGFDKIVTDFDLTRDQLLVNGGSALRYPGSIRFSGLALEPFKPDPALSLTLNVDDLDLNDLIRTTGADLPSVLALGTVSTDDILVSGTLKDLRVRQPFNVSLHDASVNGLLLRDVSARAEYNPEGLRILSAGASVADGQISVSGLISKTGELDLQAQAKGVNLEVADTALSESLAGKLKGVADASAHITGKASDLRVDGDLAGRQLAYNNFTIGDVTGRVRKEGDRLEAPELTLREPGATETTGGRVAISGLAYDLKTKAVAGRVRWDDIALTRLRDLIEASAFAQGENGKDALKNLRQITGSLRGGLSGTLALRGTTDDPQASLTWNAKGVSLDEYQITSFTGSAQADKMRIVIPDPATPAQVARLESPQGSLEARALNLEFGGDLTADVDAYKIDLALLDRIYRNATGHTLPLTGTIDTIGLLASGKASSPVLDVSVSLRDVAYRGELIDRIDLDHATIQEGRIEADTIRFAKNDITPNSDVVYRGTARGRIGFSWQPPYIPEDAPLNLQADIPEQSLAIIGAFVPDAVSVTDGRVSAQARITGTRSAPNVTGALSVQASRLQVGDFATGLRDLKGTVAFEGDRITIRDGFTARSQVYRRGLADARRQGDLITLAGSIPLRADSLTQPTGGITLRTDKLVFDENPLPGLKSGTARGQASVNLTLGGSVFAPIIAGDVNLSDATATLPRDFGGLQPGGSAPLVDPRFDLRLHLDRNVRLVSTQLNARTDGDIALNGSLTAPRVQGQLALREGSLTLPTTRFKILPPGSLSLLYPVYDLDQPGLRINVNDLKAQGNITATSTAGVRKRYRVTVTARGPLTGATTDPITGESRLALDFQTDPDDLAIGRQALVQKLAGILGGADMVNQFGRNPGQALTDELTNVFTGAVLPSLFDRPAEALGFEELSIGYDPIQRLNLTLSRQLLGPLFVTYNRSLSATREMYDLKLSLRFRERYQLSYDTDEQHTQQFLLEGVWRF